MIRRLALFPFVVIPQRSGGICFLSRGGYPAAVPGREYAFYVYILASRSRTLYIGVTRTLRARVAQHREMIPGSFTARYNIDRLVYAERYQYVGNAIAREKELKDWNRAKKLALIQRENPTWEDWRLGGEGCRGSQKSRFLRVAAG